MTSVFGRWISIGLAGLTLGLPLRGQEETAEYLVAKALQNPVDEEAVTRAIASLKGPNPVTIPAYRKLFTELTEKKLRQRLALSLLAVGEKDDVYFGELAKYAQAAIASAAPNAFEQTADGSDIKSHINPAFIRWCEGNHAQLPDCAKTVAEYGVDVMMLAYAKDSRAIPMLRQALNTDNVAVVKSAVHGLAWLKDTDSIPLIAQQLRRFPPTLSALIASALADFDDPRVGPLLDRFITDQKWREELDESIRKRRAGRK
jgi:HEAT repeat protein